MYKGTSAVKGAINPQRFTSLKAAQKAEASESECIPKILRQAANSKKEKCSLEPLVRISFSITEVKEGRLTNRAGDLSVIGFHCGRCCQSVI
jgi:hypothetical protein